MTKTIKILVLTLLAALSLSALAQEAAIRKNLPTRLPQLKSIDEVRPSGMPGLFEVRVNGTEIYYSDAQGNYLDKGALGALGMGGLGFLGPGTLYPFRWETNGPFRLGEVARAEWCFESLSAWAAPTSVPAGLAVVVAKFELAVGYLSTF